MLKLYSSSTLQFLCQKYQFKPAKRMGQNFLIDKNILAKIVKAAELSKKDIVLEIGPGFGVLTGELAQRTKKVIAVEKDNQLSQILEKDIFSGIKNIEIINQDILKYSIPAKLKKYKVVANLPYYISKPVIKQFISLPPSVNQLSQNCRDKQDLNYKQAVNQKTSLNKFVLPSLLVLLLQKEVAQKICAKPPDMNLMALSAQFYTRPQIISYVSQNSFWPKPTVASAILKITPNLQATMTQRLVIRDLFFQLAKAGFGHKRKKLVSNLNQWLNRCNRFQSSGRPVSINMEKILTSLGFKNTARAQELGVEDWVRLTLRLSELM